MKRLMRIFFVSITMIFVLQVPASAESLQDNLVPQDTETGAIGEVDLNIMIILSIIMSLIRM